MRRAELAVLILAIFSLIASGCTFTPAGTKVILYSQPQEKPLKQNQEPPKELAEKIVKSMFPPELRDNVSIAYEGSKNFVVHEFTVSFTGETRKLYITESRDMVLFAQEITPEYLQNVEEALGIPRMKMPPLNETAQAEPPIVSVINTTSTSLEDGWYLFYLPTCPHCIRQIKILGDEVSKVNMIDCSTQEEICDRYSIRGTPTWLKIQNSIEVERLEGMQSLGVLKDKGVF